MSAIHAEIQSEAESIHEQFPATASPALDDVAERLESLVDQYRVPLDEAKRATRNHFLDEYDLEYADLEGATEDDDPEPTPVGTVASDNEWLQLVVAEVVELWEPRHESIGQVGLLGDDSGTIKFVKWAKADLPELAEGETYRFEQVVTDEYEGRYSLNLNSATEITDLDQEIEVGDTSAVVEGALVAIQQGSGLIKRCTHEDCSRVLRNGRCSEHGDDGGEFDLRIKGIVDDGHEPQQVVFDAEATEAFAGMSLPEAKQRAQDALDTSVVADALEAAVVGRYCRIEGRTAGEYLLVDEVVAPEMPTDGSHLQTAADPEADNEDSQAEA